MGTFVGTVAISPDMFLSAVRASNTIGPSDLPENLFSVEHDIHDALLVILCDFWSHIPLSKYYAKIAKIFDI